MIFVVLVCAVDCSPALQTDDALAKKIVTFPQRFRELGMTRATGRPRNFTVDHQGFSQSRLTAD